MLLAYLAARLGNAGGGVPNPFEAPAGEVAAYYADRATFTATSGYLYFLAAVCLVVFAAGLRTRLAAPGENDIRGWATAGLAGAGLYAVLLVLVGLLQLALPGVAQREGAEEFSAGLAVVWAMAVVALVPGSVPLLLGFGVAGRRSGLFSGMLSGLALAGALLGLVPPPEVVGPLSPAAASLVFVLSEFQPWLLVLWTLGAAFVVRRPEIAAGQAAEPEVRELAG